MDITDRKPRKDGMVYADAIGDTYSKWVFTQAKKGRISKCDHCDLYSKAECRRVACHTGADGRPIDGIWKKNKISKPNGIDEKE